MILVDNEEEKNAWENVEFQANYVKAHDDISTETEVFKFLTSEKAHGVVFSPESASRADGILMLDKSHAITLGSKFYSKTVCTDEVISQYRSCDMSRQYLQNEIDIPSYIIKRNEWIKMDLHRVQAVRILFTWPDSTKNGYDSVENYKHRLGKHFTVDHIRDQVFDDDPNKNRVEENILPLIKIRINPLFELASSQLDLFAEAFEKILCEESKLQDKILMERKKDTDGVNYVINTIYDGSNVKKIQNYLISKSSDFEYVDEMNRALQKMNDSEKTTYLSGSIKIDKSKIKYQEIGKMKLAVIEPCTPPMEKNQTKKASNAKTPKTTTELLASKPKFKESIHIFDIVDDIQQDCIVKINKGNIKHLIGGKRAFTYSTDLYKLLFGNDTVVIPKMGTVSKASSFEDAIKMFLSD